MAYRSLKRVFDETSLERKCRIFFAVSLAILITVAFGWVEFNAERMVMRTTRQKGRDLVDMALLRFHFLIWSSSTRPPISKPLDQRELLDRKLLEELVIGFDRGNYKAKFLAFKGNRVADAPADALEEDFMRQLRLEQRQLKEQERVEEAGGDSPLDQSTAHQTARKRIYRERHLSDTGEYQYFEPVYWDKKKCLLCHSGLAESAPGPLSEIGSADHDPPFRVVKIVMPYEETQAAIRSARAGLMAVGIATITVAMVLLYVIVRYVIVRPLKHLRDVSDAISRGNTELRADIQTNDEFEELAASFNRMLRHLTDTQADLQQVNKDLDKKIDQLAQANLRLYEMNRLKGDFLANMSHELRTPLNSIIGFSEVLQGIDSLNDRQKRYARNIQKSGRLLLDMINDILDLAKMEAGKMELRPAEFRIGALVQTQCDLVRSLTDDKNIDLEVDIDPNLLPLYQDQGKVQQILTNLLSNAIKFTPEGGRISVAATHDADQDRLRLTVSDTGVGIAEEDREVIFEKFRQGANGPGGGDNLTREYSGTGLGLSIVKELCILLGGEISFESEVGKGSSFTVLLPMVCADQPCPSSEIAAQLEALTKYDPLPRLTSASPSVSPSDSRVPSSVAAPEAES